MATLTKIFDGQLQPNQIYSSSVVKNPLFLMFVIPNSPLEQGIEIGFVLSIAVSIISITGIANYKKDVVLQGQEFQGTLTSYSVINVPREYAESPYPLTAYFNSSIPIDEFQCYALTTHFTSENLQNTVNNVQQQVNNIQGQLNTVQGQVTVLQGQVTNIQAIVNSLAGLVGTIVAL